MRFCSDCGGQVAKLDAEFTRYQCADCGTTHYLNPKLGAAVLIDIDGQLLLVRRAIAPNKGDSMLPAGYVEYEESCEDTAVREAREELGVETVLTGLHGVYSYQDDPRAHTVLVVYRAEIVSGELTPGDDVDQIKLFDRNSLPTNIAFAGSQQAIQDYLADFQDRESA